MYDICILGRGPAGLSAGIYAVRAGAKTLVLGGTEGALAKARRIDNYFGIASVSGTQLLELGEAQYTALGGEICAQEVTAAEFAAQGFVLHTPQQTIETKAVVLAMGRARKRASIEGETDFLGKGVSHCAICDGFFFKKKKVGVLGSGAYAASEASQLMAFTSDVTVFTDGEAPQAEMPCPVETAKLSRLIGDGKLAAAVGADGTEYPLDGLFIAKGTAGTAEFALKLGVRTENGNILVDRDGMTALPGVFAAGDCLGGLCQVATAVGSGALAGQRAAEFVRRMK